MYDENVSNEVSLGSSWCGILSNDPPEDQCPERNWAATSHTIIITMQLIVFSVQRSRFISCLEFVLNDLYQNLQHGWCVLAEWGFLWSDLRVRLRAENSDEIISDL